MIAAIIALWFLAAVTVVAFVAGGTRSLHEASDALSHLFDGGL